MAGRLNFGLVLLLALAGPAPAVGIGFEELAASLAPGGVGSYAGADGAGGFTSEGAHFSNHYSGGFWQGFGYSQLGETR